MKRSYCYMLCYEKTGFCFTRHIIPILPVDLRSHRRLRRLQRSDHGEAYQRADCVADL